MDLNDGQHADGPPAKRSRLSSPEPGGLSELSWNLVSQFNSELPEELGNLPTITSSTCDIQNLDANVSQNFETQLSNTPTAASNTVILSDTTSPSPRISVVSTATVSSGGIQMCQFNPIAGKLGQGQLKLPSGAVLPGSTANIGSVVMNLANSSGSPLIPALGNIVSIQRPRSNVMAVVTNRPTGGIVSLLQNDSAGVVLAGTTPVSGALLRPMIPNRSIAPNRVILNVNTDYQQGVAMQTASVAQFPTVVGIQRKVPLSVGSTSITVPVTNLVSVPQLGVLARGNGLPVQPLTTLQHVQVPGQSTNITTTVDSRQMRTPVGAETAKCRLIQQQLVLLLHAHKCQRREQENGVVAAGQMAQCTVPHCRTMKDVLKHMGECGLGKACKVPHCASSRQIITHWKNCTRVDCAVCRPLKSAQDKRQVNVQPGQPLMNRPQLSNPGTSASDPQNPDLMRAYLALGLSPPNLPQLQQQDIVIPAQQSASNVIPSNMMNAVAAVSTNWMTPKNLSETVASQLHKADANATTGKNSTAIGSAAGESSIGVGIGFGALIETPHQGPMQESKSWHDAVTADLRNHLVYKLVQAIFPTPDQSALRDKRISNLVNYARKVEADMYESATSKEQYYLFLAEKIYKIQKELEEKRLKRMQEKNVSTAGAPLAIGGAASDQAGILVSGAFNSQTIQTTMPRAGLTPGLRLPLINHSVNGPVAMPNVVGTSASDGSAFSLANAFVGNLGTTTANSVARLPGSLVTSSTAMSSTERAQLFFQEVLARQKVQLEQKPATVSSGSIQLVPKQLSGLLQRQQQQQQPLQSQTQIVSCSPASHVLKSTPTVKPATISELVTQTGVASIGHDSGSVSINQEPSLVEIETANMVETGKSNQDIKLEIKTEGETLGVSICSTGENSNETEKMKTESNDDVAVSQFDNSLDGTKMDIDAPASAPPPNPINKKCWKLNELRQHLMPVLEKLYRMEPESIPFRQPVDPIQLQIPDYFTIIKKPMDLSTIKRKLDTGQYTDPWQFVDDVWLMFDNAWLYNRRSSKVHKFCTKLSETFEVEIDRVMKLLGFCCGQKYVFCPQVLCCYGKPMCTISVGAAYYSYQNRYVYCEKCFTEIEGDEVELVDDPTQPSMRIQKNLFTRFMNNDLEPEQFVVCTYCGRKHHQICALYMEPVSSSSFVCDACSLAHGIPKKINKYTSKKLPQTNLGNYLEKRVNLFLKKKDAGAGDVSIRVLSSSEKAVEVKPGMKARCCDSSSGSDFPASFPYVAKAIFAFEEIDGTDVCFFGMHVQEYGSNCSAPNSRRVYLAYLDSVNFFQPKNFRTSVYHEILIGYLDYVKNLGYMTAHIWACPPGEGDDYIFHCHPPEMKIPKAKRLQEWYKKMLDKAIIERIVIDYKDVLRDAKEGNIQDVTQIPYFEGDFWPNVLEESIKELEQEEQDKRMREETEAATGLDLEEQKPEGEEINEMSSQSGKKKGQKGVGVKKKNNKNKASVHRKAGKKCSQVYAGNDLVQKLFLTMEKHREVFFVVRLHSSQIATSLLPINDPDQLVVNDLMDGRDNFLMMAREKHYEFSSLRRAKFSTMAMLYELHTQGRDNFVYTCNNCKANIETHYHCNTCDDFDLCLPCYKKGEHQHPMEKRGLDLDEGNAEGEDRQLSPVESRRQSIQRCIQSLCHASQCRDANCHTSSCAKMKRVIQHTRLCRRKTSSYCPVCKQLIALCCYHAKNCTESKCAVPFCLQIRHKLHQQQLQTRFHQSQMERRRMALMALHNPSSTLTHTDHHVVLPFSKSTVTTKPSTESISVTVKDKPASSATVASQQMEMLTQQQVDGNVFATKVDPVLGQAAYVTKPALIQAHDSAGAEQLDQWKNLISPIGHIAASQTADDSLPVATAAAAAAAAAVSTGAVVPASAASTPSASAMQQRLLFQKLVAAVKSSHGTEQQQLLKMMARTNPQLLSTFIKQMYANNRKRMELVGTSTNSQMTTTPATGSQTQSLDMAKGGQEATSSQVTVQLMPTQTETTGIAPVQAVIGLTPPQQRPLSVASPRLAIANGNRVHVGTDQMRLSLQQPFPPHLLHQLSLQQQQQLQLQRSVATAAATVTTGQSPRMRMNSNILCPPQTTEIASVALSNPAPQQPPLVMVTLTQAGNTRLPGVNVGSYPIQSTGNVAVGQGLAMLRGLQSPLMTTNPQHALSSGSTVRQSGMTNQFALNPVTTHHYPTLSVHAVPSSNGGGSIITQSDRPGSTDQVMLSQLQSNYQVNNDSSVTPLTPQDQLSRYVEQL